MTSMAVHAMLPAVTRDHKHVIIAALALTTAAVMTYFVTDCVARVVEARAYGVANLANALQLR